MKRKLTIGFVLDDGLDSTDGVQQYVLTLGKWFTSSGHTVHYLVGETKRTDIKNIHSLSRNLKVKFNANSLTTPLPASGRKINSLLSNINFDILHVQAPYSPFMAAKIISRAAHKTKIVGTFHILPYGKLQAVSINVLGSLLSGSLKRFDKMLAVSKPASKLCQSSFGVKAEVLPNAVDISEFSKNKRRIKDDGIIRIVFLGRLVERKGCKQLIKAVDYICKYKLAGKKIELTIAGAGPQENEIKQLIADKGLGSIVSMPGFIEEKNKSKLLSEADIAVFPSLGGESFGIVLIEAIAAGSRVVLGGDNEGYRSVLTDAPDCVVDVSDHVAFANKLAKFINSEKARVKARSIQEKMLDKYDVNKVGVKLEKHYQNLLK